MLSLLSSLSASAVLPRGDAGVRLVLLDVHHVVAGGSKGTRIGRLLLLRASLLKLRYVTARHVLVGGTANRVLSTLSHVVMGVRMRDHTCQLEGRDHKRWHFDRALDCQVDVLLNLLVLALQIADLCLHFGQGNCQQLVLPLLSLYLLLFLSFLLI